MQTDRFGGSHTDPSPLILAFGDSLTPGYGFGANESFAAQLEASIRNRMPLARVQNAGVSGDTSGSALARLPRLLSSLVRRPDLAIVELGANDFLRGFPLARTRANLDEIITELSRCGIPVMLAAMEAPRFLGAFAEQCDAVYQGLARKHAIPAVPFFPEGVLGNAGLTLPDRIHPNAAAIRLIVRAMLPAVWDALVAHQGIAA
ncbi:arylesterase [Sphingomonas nostoxanthinifaciens]|uniref:arylesterase n=1 Tax=Sphingomonas nostoxanthinifaciens TaxID=2872652 RepID=UPI001CC1F0E6|nr:arylesterase [Sphingomonas nostoxanthinifaciens]UAK25668.1 arylesterase [Sphingomonas nostoxanthinifaciens]